jgi:replication factor C small subunit
LEFNIPNKEKYNMAIQIMARLEQILKAEKVKYNKPVVAELINNYFPDIRRMLNELQRYSISGEIDTGLISSINNAGFDELFTFMKTKNFTEVRKWIATHSDLEPEYVFRNIFDNLSKKLEKDSIPSAILILADYQYKMSFSADHEICMSACLAELMMNVSFQ